MGRDAEDPGDVVDGEDLRLDELGRLGGEVDGLVFETILKKGSGTIGGGGLPMGHEAVVVVVAQGLLRLQGALDGAAGPEVVRGELLRRDALADGGGIVGDRVDTPKAVEGEEHEVEHLALQVGAVQEGEVRVLRLHDVHLLSVHEDDLDPVRIDRMEGDRLAPVVLDEGEGVALTQEPGEDGEPEHEDVHVLVRSVIQEHVGRMLGRGLVAAVLGAYHDGLGETGDIFGEEFDGGEDSGKTQGRLRVDGDACVDSVAINADKGARRRGGPQEPAADGRFQALAFWFLCHEALFFRPQYSGFPL